MKSNYKNIDEANNKIDSIIKQFEICKEQIQKEKQENNMNINIEIEYIKRIERENEKQKKIINDFRNQNFELREDFGTYKNQYNKLFDENEQLKQKINDLISNYPSHTKLTQLEEENEELKEDNEILIELKNIWLDSHRLVTQERDKLKKELKEYRGF